MKYFILPLFILFLASCSDDLKPVKISSENGTIYVHPTEVEYQVEWGTFGLLIGASDTVDGEANTALIVSNDPGPSAAKICDQLVAYGYDDWYLPSIRELMAIRDEVEAEDSQLPKVWGGMFWSSTESNLERGKWLQINYGHSYNNEKFKNTSVFVYGKNSRNKSQETTNLPHGSQVSLS